VTVTYDPPDAESLPDGVTPVTATATDSQGNTAECTFNVTRSRLQFHGFYSPIGNTGGSCGSPAVKQKLGSKIPVKFDTACNGGPYTGGQPMLTIQKCQGSTTILTGNFELVGNEWHFNWDTSGLVKGVYRLIATLQDQTTREVFVDLTK
jgi:hypothetical protein